ncbi:pyridoxal-phosphate dependent enzyme [Streptomyces canarius]
MTHQWRGIIEEYRDRLPVSDTTPVVTLREGGTPLVPAQVLSERTGCEVHLKVEGANPTGSFKDRGMTMAISKAKEEGAKAVICASTGNTSASAAAYAVRAGMVSAVLVPQGKIALGKMGQALLTETARGLLPRSVPHVDAAANAGRAALLVEALTRRPELLLPATEDRLHQEYRAPAMPESAALVERLRADGIPAVISGAGPTVMALADADSADKVSHLAGEGWAANRLDLDVQGASVLPLAT